MSTITKNPSYSEALEELQQNLNNVLPKEVLDVFEEDVNQLKNTHKSILKLAAGDKAPNFSLPNAVGEIISLDTLLNQGRVVLTFYRGSWCPYCNLQLNQYKMALDEMRSHGAHLVAISPQTPDESLNIKQKNDLSFEVLSDNGNMVARQFTTVFKNSNRPIEAMNSLGIDFESHYSDNSHELPVPAVFIIEKDGIISFAQAIDGDYRKRVEAMDIINSLKTQ